MPHLIVEHSADISKNAVLEIYTLVKEAMIEVKEGNFDPDQCKCRSFAFEEYFVGNLNQKHSSFLHITIKVLSGRSLKVRQELAKKVMKSAKDVFDKLTFSPSAIDEIAKTLHQIEDVVTGISHPQFPLENHSLAGKRCDISVDIVEMDKEAYQKIRTEN